MHGAQAASAATAVCGWRPPADPGCWASVLSSGSEGTQSILWRIPGFSLKAKNVSHCGKCRTVLESFVRLVFENSVKESVSLIPSLWLSRRQIGNTMISIVGKKKNTRVRGSVKKKNHNNTVSVWHDTHWRSCKSMLKKSCKSVNCLGDCPHCWDTNTITAKEELH